MKKIMVLIVSLALVACASNSNNKKVVTNTQSIHEHKAGEPCTADHEVNTTEKHDGHDHAAGEACTHDEGTKHDGHDHVAGEACSHDEESHEGHNHAAGETCTADHEGTAVANHDGHNHAEGEVCSDSEGHPDPNFKEVELNGTQAKEAKIRVYSAKSSNFSSVIKTTGRISSNKTDKKVIVAPSSGVIKLNSNLVDGLPINKGVKLMTISSSKMEGGDISKKVALRFNAAKSEFKRAESLIGDKLISQRDYNAIELEFQTAKTEFNALGNSRNGIKITSPIKGYVNELLVSEGEYVEAGTPVMIVTANNSSVLTAYVSERQYGRLKYISNANFKTAYNDNVYDINKLGGKFLAYGRGENDESLLVPVSFEFPNNGDILPGSYVEVYLKERSKRNAISIPLSAITEEQNVYYVYTHRGGNLFRKNEVKLGESDGIFIEILSGVSVGDKVVVNGTHQVKLAASSGVIPAACGHAH